MRGATRLYRGASLSMRQLGAREIEMNELSEHDQGDEPVEDCDCRRCALAYRDRYKTALASVSEEIGLPPMMGPEKGDLKRLLDAGKAAMDQLRHAPRAVSAEADFEALTWTFQIAPDCRVGAGTYALVWLPPNALAQGREHSERPAGAEG